MKVNKKKTLSTSPSVPVCYSLTSAPYFYGKIWISLSFKNSAMHALLKNSGFLLILNKLSGSDWGLSNVGIQRFSETCIFIMHMEYTMWPKDFEVRWIEVLVVWSLSSTHLPYICDCSIYSWFKHMTTLPTFIWSINICLFRSILELNTLPHYLQSYATFHLLCYLEVGVTAQHRIKYTGMKLDECAWLQFV